MRRLNIQLATLQVIDKFVFIYFCLYLLNAQHHIAVFIETAQDLIAETAGQGKKSISGTFNTSCFWY